MWRMWNPTWKRACARCACARVLASALLDAARSRAVHTSAPSPASPVVERMRQDEAHSAGRQHARSLLVCAQRLPPPPPLPPPQLMAYLWLEAQHHAAQRAGEGQERLLSYLTCVLCVGRRGVRARRPCSRVDTRAPPPVALAATASHPIHPPNGPTHTPGTRSAQTRPMSTGTASAPRSSCTRPAACGRCLTTCCATARGPRAGPRDGGRAPPLALGCRSGRLLSTGGQQHKVLGAPGWQRVTGTRGPHQ